MKHHLSLGNPPYTNGTQSNSPIYPHVMMKCASDQQAWLIPIGWFHTDRHKAFRQWLFDNGLRKIKINQNNVFVEATVLTCVIYLNKGYTGPIEVTTACGVSYSYDYRKYGEIVITDSFELTDRIIKNKPANPYKFISHGIRLRDHNISESHVEGWSKIVTKVTKDNVHYGWINLKSQTTDFTGPIISLLTSRFQGIESHTRMGNNQIVPHLSCDSHLTWWRLTRFAIIEPNVLVCNKYRSLQCKSIEEAEKIRDYLKSDYCTEIFKWTRSSRTLDNSQFRFIPRIEDAVQPDHN